MAENFNYCHVVGRTDVGRKRKANEDNMSNAITQNGLVSVVCDGMGGHVGGATASKIAVSTIIQNLTDNYYDDPRIAIGESIDRANKAILGKAAEQPELTGMGSTCVLLLVRAGKVYIGHVGDSRIYLVRSRRIIQLTKDHSYVQMLVDSGEITKEQAEHHPRKNEITNALGIPNMSPATIAEDAIIPESGDCFLLCSDGLSGMVDDKTLCREISRQTEKNTQNRVDRLIALANDNGGVDNITAQLVEFSVAPADAAIANRKIGLPKWTKTAAITAAVIILGIIAFVFLRGNGDDTDAVITESFTLPDIEFTENGDIVQFVYGSSNFAVKRNGNVLFERTETFDANSLKVENPNIAVEYNNSLLKFTSVSPGDTVLFSISSANKDKPETYRFSFAVVNSSKEPVNSFEFPGADLQDNPVSEERPQTEYKKNDEKKKVNEEKNDTIRISFEYTSFERDSKILITYSAKPTIKFNKDEENIFTDGSKIKEIKDTELGYDDKAWKTRKTGSQFQFIPTGTSNKDFTFRIPCLKDDGKKVVLIVSLKHKQAEGKPKENTDTVAKNKPEEKPDTTGGDESPAIINV